MHVSLGGGVVIALTDLAISIYHLLKCIDVALQVGSLATRCACATGPVHSVGLTRPPHRLARNLCASRIKEGWPRRLVRDFVCL